MSITDVTQEFNDMAAGKFKCRAATMDYLDGGARELFKFHLGDRIIDITVPAMTPRREMIELAIAEASKV